MKIAKIIIGSIIVLMYSLSTLANIMNLFLVDAEHMSRAIGMVVGSGVVFSIGLALLVSGIRNKKFTKAFSK